MANTQAITQCPKCNQALPEKSRKMSNCIYCNFPFEFSSSNDKSETNEKGEGPYKSRIDHIKTNDEYDKVLNWDPPEGIDHYRAKSKLRRGGIVTAIGAAIALWAGFLSSGEGFNPFVIVGAMLLVLGIWMVIKGSGEVRDGQRWPLLRRPCAVADRRSVTAIKGMSGRTNYHFTLEFEDGNRGEFRWPGRGNAQEPLATGIAGIAYTRGETLLSFRQLR